MTRESGYQIRFGVSGVGLGMRGRPRLRVKGVRTTRWERVSLPFPMVSGVKSLEEAPRGASSFEVMPFPGNAASSAETKGVARRMEHIVKGRRC